MWMAALERIRTIGWLDVIMPLDWRERHVVSGVATNWQLRHHMLRVWLLLLLVHIVDIGRPEVILGWDSIPLRFLHPSPLMGEVFLSDLARLLLELLLFFLASSLLTL